MECRIQLTIKLLTDNLWECDKANLKGFLFFGCSFLTGTRSARFSYGFSSFKGKRASMEDFFETSTSEIDGQMVAFFGVFDGRVLVYCLSKCFSVLAKNLIQLLILFPDSDDTSLRI